MSNLNEQTLAAACRLMIQYAAETRELLDNGDDEVIRKRLDALSGNLPGHDADLDLIHKYVARQSKPQTKITFS